MLTFMFSAEEINLMCIFDTTNRKTLLAELRESLDYVYEKEMRDVYVAVIEKLESLDNATYFEIGLHLADEYDEYIMEEEWDIAE